jgi:hypothetical protein
MKTKTQVLIDFDINAAIKVDLSKQRKKKETELNKEQYLGKMIEERHVLDRILKKKKLTFEKLIANL